MRQKALLAIGPKRFMNWPVSALAASTSRIAPMKFTGGGGFRNSSFLPDAKLPIGVSVTDSDHISQVLRMGAKLFK